MTLPQQILGWFYLHTNGELIFKNHNDAIKGIQESDLCKTAWAWDGSELYAWLIVIEALALDVDRKRVFELATTWKLDDEAAETLAKEIGIEIGIDTETTKYARRADYNDDPAHNPCGFGPTYLEAMADLCKLLEFTGGTNVDRKSFFDLVHIPKAKPVIDANTLQLNFDEGNTKQVNYSPEENKLTVTFRNDNRYEYYRVPAEVWEKAKAATSFGSFLATDIKGKFEYKKL